MRVHTIRTLRAETAAVIDRLRAGPALIVRNSRPVGVLLAPAAFDAMRDRERDAEDATAIYDAVLDWLDPDPGSDPETRGDLFIPAPLANGVHRYGVGLEGVIPRAGRADPLGATVDELLRELARAIPHGADHTRLRAPTFVRPDAGVVFAGETLRLVHNELREGRFAAARLLLRAAGGMTGRDAEPLSTSSTNRDGPWRITRSGWELLLLRRSGVSWVTQLRPAVSRAAPTATSRVVHRRDRARRGRSDLLLGPVVDHELTAELDLVLG